MRTVTHTTRLTVPELEGDYSPRRQPTGWLRLAGDEDTIMVRDGDGHPLLAVGRLPTKLTTDLHRVLTTMKFSTTLRSHTGYSNKSAVFGWKTPKPLQQRESCSAATVMSDRRVAQVLLATSDHCKDFMVTNLPDIVTHDLEAIKAVKPQWRMTMDATDLWTSGVINHTSVMPYHYDKTNFQTWSAMPVLRAGVGGGHLHMPELDLVVPCNDGTCVYWLGRDVMHGVTPIVGKDKGGYRFTIVFYALKGMVDCATYAIETAKGNAKRVLTERRAADGTSWAMTAKVPDRPSRVHRG